MPVYVDVLLIVNGFVNYLLLVMSMKYLRLYISRLRLLAASALGSVFSLKIFLPEIPLLPELLIRAVMCAAISLTAFGFGGRRAFLRSSCVFLTVNLLFGGLMSAIFLFFDTGMMLYRNGTVYFDIDLKILAVTSVASFAVISALSKIISRRASAGSICSVTVFYSGKSVHGRGFFDTGNGLREVFSGYPVIIARFDAVKELLPEETKACCADGDIKSTQDNIRMIPVCTAAGNSVLPSFRPDKIIIKDPKSQRTYDKIYIAVSRREFFGGEFEFILNNELTGDASYEHTEKNKIPAVGSVR